MPPDYATFKYGWVTTSHKAQGRTAETVVVAAQALDRKAFYVALSRGRKRVALHCPEKEFLKQQLSFRDGDRLSVHDLAEDRHILPLSKDARSRKAKTLPDMTYKSIAERARKLMKNIKRLAGNLVNVKRKISARRARNRKYGFGIVTEEIKLEIEHQNALEVIEEQRRQEERLARFREASAPELSPYQEAMKKIAKMEKRQASTPPPAKKLPAKDIVYPIPNPKPRESTVSKPVSDTPVLPTGKRHRGLESLERMKAQEKPQLSPYEEALQKMKEFKICAQEHKEAERKAAEERAEQEKLARKAAAREQAEREAVEAVRLEAERKAAEERLRKDAELRATQVKKKKPSRGMDL